MSPTSKRIENYAIKQYKSKISQDPNNLRNYWELGNLFDDLGDQLNAIKYYRLVIKHVKFDVKIDQYNANTYNYGGLALDRLGLPTLAVKAYRIAIKMNPNCSTYYHNLGLVELCVKHYSKSIQDLETAIQLKPSSSRLYDDLGEINEDAKRYTEAINNFKMAILLNQDESKDRENVYYFDLARTDNEVGDYAEGVTAMKNAIATLPSDADVPAKYSDGLQILKENLANDQKDNDDQEDNAETQNYDKDYDHENNDLSYDPDVDYTKRLNQLIGLGSVKSMIKTYIHQVQMNEVRTGARRHPRMHLVFEGNPGTGKTTVAKLFCRILYQKHIITKKRFISVNATQLVNSRYGMSAKQVRSFVKQSIGGVLFIDEAYYLAHRTDGNSLCQDEAMDAFLSAIDQHPNDLVVIMAGYTNKMEHLLNRSNPGLQSRFSNEDRINFPDYSSDECIQILNFFMHQNGYHVKDQRAKTMLEEYMHKFIMTKRNDSQNTFANARTVENIFERMTHHLANRLLDRYTVDQLRNLPDDKRTLLNEFNLDDVKRTFECYALSTHHQAADELKHLIGLKNVKALVQHYINYVRVSRLRHGNVNPEGMDLVFEGNPGTGKTTVAKIFCKLLYQKGLVKSDNYVALSASSLESAVVGQSAAHLRQAFHDAQNGVLFIDEAYALMNTKKKGNNLIPELVDDLTEYKDSVVVIMAGYPKPMKHLLEKGNEGLSSRFQYRVHFKDYTDQECWQILNYDVKQDSLRYDNRPTRQALKRGFIAFIKQAKANDQEHFANARTVKIFFRRLQNNFANRLCNQDSGTWLKTLKVLHDKRLNTITKLDVTKTLAQCRNMYKNDDAHRIGF